MNFNKIKAFIKASRDPDTTFGDLAILKTEAFNVQPPTGIESRLENVRGYMPAIDLEEMRRKPAGSLGREYVRQLDDNGFKPFALSDGVQQRVEDHTFIVRYLITHDFLHVLTGFDTTNAGEIGVLALTVEQGFAPGGRVQEWAARCIYPLQTPRQWRAIGHNRVLGHQLGREADFLLNIRYEELLDEPVSVLRERFHVPEPDVSGVLPGIPGGRLPGTLMVASSDA